MKRCLFLIAGLSLLFTGCGKSKSASYSSTMNTFTDSTAGVLRTSKKMVTEEAFEAPVMADMEVAEMEADYFEPASADFIASDYEVNKKLIKSGFIDLSIDSLEDIELKVQSYAKLYGGYITNTYLSENSYNAEIKIPCDKFEVAMNNAGTLGEIKSRSQNAVDVTDEYYDLESRITSKKILKDKMEGYLKKAESVKDLMQIEKELNMVVSDLEAMEGRLKRLSHQVDYSTININARLPVGYKDTGFVWPDMGEGFKKLGLNSVNFFAGFLMFIIYVLIFGIPIVLVGAFLYWLLFGKVGLIIKLFKYLSKKK